MRPAPSFLLAAVAASLIALAARATLAGHDVRSSGGQADIFRSVSSSRRFGRRSTSNMLAGLETRWRAKAPSPR